MSWWRDLFSPPAPERLISVTKGPLPGGTFTLIALLDVPDAEWPAYAGRDEVAGYTRTFTVTRGDRAVVCGHLYVPRRLGLSDDQRQVIAHEISHLLAAANRLDPDPTHLSDGGRLR